MWKRVGMEQFLLLTFMNYVFILWKILKANLSSHPTWYSVKNVNLLDVLIADSLNIIKKHVIYQGGFHVCISSSYVISFVGLDNCNHTYPHVCGFLVFNMDFEALN